MHPVPVIYFVTYGMFTLTANGVYADVQYKQQINKYTPKTVRTVENFTRPSTTTEIRCSPVVSLHSSKKSLLHEKFPFVQALSHKYVCLWLNGHTFSKIRSIKN